MDYPPANLHRAYHAHLYFGPQTVGRARALAMQAGELFKLQVGRVHERPVGPHPQWSCQLAFGSEEFARLIPWLDAHREGLDILVHGLSGNELEDHTRHAFWLGRDWPLDLSVFRSAAGNGA